MGSRTSKGQVESYRGGREHDLTGKNQIHNGQVFAGSRQYFGRKFTRSRTADEAVSQLSQACGQVFEMEEKTGRGLALRVAAEKEGEPPRSLSKEENEKIKQKLIDITQTIVYHNLSKGGI